MLDIFLAVGSAACSVWLAYLGVHLTVHPPADEAKEVYKFQFLLVGLISVVLIGAQAYRNYSSGEDLKTVLRKQGTDITAIKDEGKRPIQITIPPNAIPKQPRPTQEPSPPRPDQRLELKSQALQLAAEILTFAWDRQKSGLSAMRVDVVFPLSGDFEKRWKAEENRANAFNAETLSLYQGYYEQRALTLLATMRNEGIDVQRAWYKPGSAGAIWQFAMDLVAVVQNIH